MVNAKKGKVGFSYPSSSIKWAKTCACIWFTAIKGICKAKAIDFAKKNNAILVIAKIDRLARNVFFVSSLMETGVEFVACDLPQATNFTIHLYAALAEMEAKLIGERTKNALAEKKKRGFKLGTPANLTEKGKQKGIEVIKQKAINNKANIQATALIVEYRAKGFSYDKIALTLNQLNFSTANGKLHNSTSVLRLYKRHLESK